MDSNNENDFTLLYCVSFDGLHFGKIDDPGVREKIEEDKKKFNARERIRKENESNKLKVLWNKVILWIAGSLLSLRKR